MWHLVGEIGIVLVCCRLGIVLADRTEQLMRRVATDHKQRVCWEWQAYQRNMHEAKILLGIESSFAVEPCAGRIYELLRQREVRSCPNWVVVHRRW